MTFARNELQLSWNISACGRTFKNVFMILGSLTNSPSFTVLTLAYGTLNKANCRVALTGTYSEKRCTKKDESILPLRTFRMNIKSCWIRRDDNATTLKCFMRSLYSNDLDWLRQFAFSHRRNLCCTLSTLVKWTAAAPPQITLQYSRTERTCA